MTNLNSNLSIVNLKTVTLNAQKTDIVRLEKNDLPYVLCTERIDI